MTDRSWCVVNYHMGCPRLATAKSFFELNPHKSSIVFLSAQTLGGFWASEQRISGMKTKDMFGTYEYFCFPRESKRIQCPAWAAYS